jgi:hypothetical protein
MAKKSKSEQNLIPKENRGNVKIPGGMVLIGIPNQDPNLT